MKIGQKVIPIEELDNGPFVGQPYPILDIMYDYLNGTPYVYLGQKAQGDLFKTVTNVWLPSNGKLWIHASKIVHVSKESLTTLVNEEKYELAAIVHRELNLMDVDSDKRN